MFLEPLLGIILPGAIATVILLVGWRPWPRASRPEAATWSGALAFGAAMLIAFFVQQPKVPKLPPHERWEWIAMIVAGATVLGVLDGLLRPRAARTALLAALVAGGTGLAMRLPDLDGAVARVGLALALLVLTAALAPVAARRPGPIVPVALVIVFATLATAAAAAGFKKLAFIGAAAAAAATACAAVGLLNPKLALGGGAAMVVATIAVLLAATGHAYDYGDVPWWCFALPPASLALLWLGELPALARGGAWRAALLRALVVLVPCVIALVPCVRALIGETDAGDEMWALAAMWGVEGVCAFT